MIVTISREYGAAGLAVADGVARELGYELLTDDLPAAVAARLGSSTEEVAARVDSDASLSERILTGLGAATPEVVSANTPRVGEDFDEDVRREIDADIRKRAARGEVVILGRLGNAILAGWPGLVRVFLTAPHDWRIARLIETFHFSREVAAEELTRTDAARRRVAKDRYNVVWGDPRHYDLIVDTSRFGIEGTIAIVTGAIRKA